MPAIFHITHVRNVPGLIEHGGLLCDRQCNGRGLNRTGIGYAHIKERRMIHVVPLPPGGTLGDYVPFYFAPRSPMLFTIHKGNTPDYDGGQTPIIHLVSSVEAVVAWRPELQWLFTDGHADMELSDYYNDLSSLDQVDWPVMRCRY